MAVLTAKLVSALLGAALAAGQTHDVGREPKHVPTETHHTKEKTSESQNQPKYRHDAWKQSEGVRLRGETSYLRIAIVTDENSRLWMIGKVFNSSGADVNGTADFITRRPHQLEHTKEKER